MKDPVAIRYFKTQDEAEKACTILKKMGFDCEVDQDKFVDEPISKYGVPDRFKILVNREDFYKIAKYLKERLG